MLCKFMLHTKVSGLWKEHGYKDEKEGSAGLETRLESFVDIIKIKKEEQHGKM